MLNILKNRFSTKLGVFWMAVLVGALAVVLFAIPQVTNVHTSAENCVNPPIAPTFNHWPVTYEDTNTPLCHDYPAIDAGKFIEGQDTTFSQSEADWQNGLQLQTGETGVALMYLHNGAANNLDPALTTAKNVKVITRTDTSVGGSHTITATFTADNADSYTRTFTVYTPDNAKLEIVPNSGQMYDVDGRVILDQSNLDLGNSTFHLGDLDACYEYSLFFTFKFKVVGETPQNTTISIDKKVRNATDSTSYMNSVDADKNDSVQYKVVVKNTGNTVAKTVTMSDNGTSGVSINSNSVTVGVADDALLTPDLWSGTIPGTLNLGDLDPGEQRVITYTGTVTADSGMFTNTAYANASNANQVSDIAKVNVTVAPNPGVLKITKSVVPTNVYNGDEVEFTVTVTNTGQSTVTNTRMEDRLPAGLTVTNVVSATHANYSSTGSRLFYEIGSLAPNASATIVFKAKITVDGPRTLCNVAYAAGDNVPTVNDDACIYVKERHVEPGVLTITKSVNDSTVYQGEDVIFTVTVTNTGDETVRNVRMEDTLPSTFDLEAVTNSTNSNYRISGNKLTLTIGNLAPNQSETIKFRAEVIATGERTICNVAYAAGDDVATVNDDACVKIIKTHKPGTPNIVISKKAYNDTKKVNAVSQSAARGDYITFTLTTTNTGTETAENYVITDDLSGVLPLADLISAPNAKLRGNVLSWEEMDIKPGQTVTKTFQVKVKESLSSSISYKITNTYGNTVEIHIPGKVVFEAPKTGVAATSAVAFAGLVTAGFVAFRNRENIIKFILA